MQLLQKLLIDFRAVDFLLLLNVVYLVFLVPYSKVEESFNTQAVYDLINYPFWTNEGLKQMDHLEFPGVVPRTFIGALILSLFSQYYPTQIFMRCILGAILCLCFKQFSTAVSQRFNKNIGTFLTLLTSVQFHLPFYMSRTLPNTFALGICLLGYSNWLGGKSIKCLCLLGIGAVVFRCDLVVLIVPIFIQMILFGEIKILHAIPIGIVAFIFAIGITIVVDTYFWGPYYYNNSDKSLLPFWKQFIWPEGIVLFFNTIENKSSQWGVHAWHWYFTSALPRALNASLIPFIITLCGFQQPRIDDSFTSTISSCCLYTFRHKDKNKNKNIKIKINLEKQKQIHKDILYYMIPAIIFIALYSILPHKELRFIFPAIPLLTLGAAYGLDRIVNNDDESIRSKKITSNQISGSKFTYFITSQLFVLLGIGTIALSLLAYNVLLLAAKNNYPGGDALSWLTYSIDKFHMSQENSTVHISADACMTGVSKFGQIQNSNNGNHIIYSKEENLRNLKGDYNKFDWLLTATNPSDVNYLPDFEQVYVAYGFSGLKVNVNFRNFLNQGFTSYHPRKNEIDHNHNSNIVSWLPPYSFPFHAVLEPKIFVLKKKTIKLKEDCDLTENSLLHD